MRLKAARFLDFIRRPESPERVEAVGKRAGESPAPVSPDLVLVAQPHRCVVVERPIRFSSGPLQGIGDNQEGNVGSGRASDKLRAALAGLSGPLKVVFRP